MSERISLRAGDVGIVDRRYLQRLSSAAAGLEAFDMATRLPKKPRVERFERLRRQYRGHYAYGSESVLREAESGKPAFCVAAVARACHPNDAAVQVESNLTEMARRYCDSSLPKGGRPTATKVSSEGYAHLMMRVLLSDECPPAGLGGLLVSAYVARPELLGLDPAASDHGPLPEGVRLMELQPGVVLCRAGDVLGEREFDLNGHPEATVALVSDRHVVAALVRVAAAVKRACSVAWSREGPRAVVLPLGRYIELMADARSAASHFAQHLVPLGEARLHVLRDGARDRAELEVIADFVRILEAPDLLYQSSDDAFVQTDDGRFRACVATADGRLLQRRTDPNVDAVVWQRAMTKGVLATAPPGTNNDDDDLERLIADYCQMKLSQQQ